MPEDPLTKFQSLLRELFQFEHGDLNFGIYRIMNLRRSQMERWITEELPKRAEAALKTPAITVETELAGRLAELRQRLVAIQPDAVDPDGRLAKLQDTDAGQEYQKIWEQQRAAPAKTPDELESDLYNHLYAFFSRYYDRGDFISQRRYSFARDGRDTYAVPYSGEEVVLHWANKDQYYIKTGDRFSRYEWEAPVQPPIHVRFELTEATVERDNQKSAQERFYVPTPDTIVWDEETRSLTVPFQFRPLTDQETAALTAKQNAARQEELLARAQDALLASAIVAGVPGLKIALLAPKNDAQGREITDKDERPVSLIEHHLKQRVAENTADYFIHKDLKRFLSGELDYYIKSEVLALDAMFAAGALRAPAHFQLVQAVRDLGSDIIDFLAQLENFQRALFEKRKFVTECHWCLTLDWVEKAGLLGELGEFLNNSEAGHRQIEEWKRLFAIEEVSEFAEPIKTEFLRSQQFLMLDTAFLPNDFTDKLLASVPDLDENTVGLLIHSENFHALNLIRERYRESLKCVYIDPPFNTESNAILYKNAYRHSSWLALIVPRLALSLELEQPGVGVHTIAIDDAEKSRLVLALGAIAPNRDITAVTVVHNPAGTMGTNFSATNEYAVFLYDDNRAVIAKEERLERPDIRDLMNTAKGAAGNYLRSTGKTCFYPIYVKDMKVVGFGQVCQDDFHPTQNVELPDGVTEVYPIDSEGIERKWVLARDTVPEHVEELFPKRDRKTGRVRIERRKAAINYKTVWHDGKYSAKKYGTELLGDIIPETRLMPRLYPKSLYLVRDCLHAASGGTKSVTICDYFAGSGTTGHAVLAMNCEDHGARKYILVEMGDHFDSVLKRRLQRVTYSKDWQDGKPLSRQGSSHIFKYLRLESYEDALDNIEFRDSRAAQPELSLGSEYALRYALDWESRHSPTRLSVDDLAAPFDYTLELRRDEKSVVVRPDLPETFNYLIGLIVHARRVFVRNDEGKQHRYAVYTGTLRRNGEKTAIIWRTCRGWSETHFQKEKEWWTAERGDIAPDATLLYVNGTSTLEGVRSLDPEFKKRMHAPVAAR